MFQSEDSREEIDDRIHPIKGIVAEPLEDVRIGFEYPKKSGKFTESFGGPRGYHTPMISFFFYSEDFSIHEMISECLGIINERGRKMPLRIFFIVGPPKIPRVWYDEASALGDILGAGDLKGERKNGSTGRSSAFLLRHMLSKVDFTWKCRPFKRFDGCCFLY